jgi:DNA-binding transcriptional ArsR family regulator
MTMTRVTSATIYDRIVDLMADGRLDRTDAQILRLLRENPTASSCSIARTLNLPRRTVSRRLKKWPSIIGSAASD